MLTPQGSGYKLPSKPNTIGVSETTASKEWRVGMHKIRTKCNRVSVVSSCGVFMDVQFYIFVLGG